MNIVENNKVEQIILHIIMALLVLMCVLPLLLMVISSFTEEGTLMRNGYSFFPEAWSLDSYRYLIQRGSTIFRGYLITIGVTLVGTSASILLTTLFAYPLSRKELPGRNIVAFFTFFTMLFNGGLVPTYTMWTQFFHIKNTFAALIIPSLLMNAFYVIMMRSYFTSNIPDALIEAARIDGAGEYTILFKVVMPLSGPMLATLALMVGLGYWNDWLNGLYYLTDSSLFSIQNILNRMIQDIQFLQSAAGSTADFGVAEIPSVGIRMAIAVIGIIPVLCIYPFFQKFFVKGIVVGGVKG